MKTLIQKKKDSSLFSAECGEQRSLPPAPTSVAAPGPHGSLPVVPLIGDQRYYGEAPGRIRASKREWTAKVPNPKSDGRSRKQISSGKRRMTKTTAQRRVLSVRRLGIRVCFASSFLNRIENGFNFTQR